MNKWQKALTGAVQEPEDGDGSESGSPDSPNNDKRTLSSIFKNRAQLEGGNAEEEEEETLNPWLGAVKSCGSLERLDDVLTSAGEKLVVIAFNAEWCLPSREMKPLLANLQKKMPQNIYLDVDIERDEEIAIKYNVECVPYYLFLRNGSVIEETEFDGADIKNLTETVTNLSKVVGSSQARLMALGHFMGHMGASK